jgi:hypothetical protein
VSRRVEVTVERETVTMLVRGQPKEGTEEPVIGDSGPESGRLEQQPPASALKEPFESYPTCGSSSMVLLAEALPGLDLTLLQQGIDGAHVHLHRFSSGKWCICKQSLHAAMKS